MCQIIAKFKYQDYLIVGDYIELLQKEDKLESERKVDYIENLFYQFKERYDLLYICREEINGDLLYLVEDIFMEYCYGVFKRILSALMTLEDELEGSDIFRRFKKLIWGIINKLKKILVDLDENLILLL